MALRERISDWWGGITPRERRIVALGGIAVPIVIAVWLGSSIKKGMSDIEKRNARARRAVAALADIRANGVEDHSDHLLDDMPSAPKSLDTFLAEAASKAGINAPATTPRGNPIPKDGFVTSTVAINLSDVTIDQLKSFLEAVEADPYVTTRNLNIQRDREKEKLDVRMDVSTYSKEQVEAEGDKDDKGAAGSGKGN